MPEAVRLSEVLMSWLPLVPIALVTAGIWALIIWDTWAKRRQRHREAWQQRLDQRGGLPPCVFCHSPTHTAQDHVKYTQAELAQRDGEPEWFLWGEW
jgi:hypothetical protein